MKKITIQPNVFLHPMPVVLIGTVVSGKANFMAVGWVSRVNYNPPMIAFSSGKAHYSNQGIGENKTFSVNIPHAELIEETDYCGMVSGRETDKSKLFTIFYGDLKNAPMIEECPVCMECKCTTTVDMATNILFIGEIVNAYSEERYLTEGKPDIKKIKPFTLSMPDNNYWAVGEKMADAWSVGKILKKK
ncbi:MAG: flavin reductase family protein [Candidatus Omnitrophota bacterium]